MRTEKEFVDLICANGGRAFIVGGWVRDRLRGIAAHDKDYAVTGMSTVSFQALFPEAKGIGLSFPVFVLNIDGVSSEIALARRERKTGSGYLGFSVESDGDVSIEEDLFRRDTTMNSMAWDLSADTLIDPYGGKADIARGIVRAVSKHFLEDPVRALRAARQAATFGYTIAPDTIVMMHACLTELLREPKERIFGELKRALAAPRPSRFFQALQAAGLLEDVFPAIYALRGKTQPVEFHPEGDAFDHTMQMVDDVAALTEDIVTRFAALVHDVGKGTTPQAMLPHHYGHEVRGLTVLEEIAERLPLPRVWYKTAEFVIREHMRAPRLAQMRKIVSLLQDAEKIPIGVAGFAKIVSCDHKSLPDYLLRADLYLAAIHAVRGSDAPPHLAGEAVGAWMHAQQIAKCRALRKQKDAPC